MNPEEFSMPCVGKFTAIGLTAWTLTSFAQPTYAACDSTGLAAKYPSLVGRTIRLAQDGESPPYSFKDPANFEVMRGLDYELATATFTCLGMKTEIKLGKWSGLLPAVIAGQADIMWNNLYYTPVRAQQVDFVTYLVAATGGLVKAGNPKKIAALSDTCGMKGAAGLGTVEETLLRKTSDECVAAGKPPLEIATYPDKPSGTRLVQSGRADIMLSDGGFVGNMVKTDGENFAQAFSIKSNFKVGPGITRTIPELRQAIADALAQLQADGTVEATMAKHGVDPKLMLPVESFTK
jgi:polar amino acid transport system substrate-binding protein